MIELLRQSLLSASFLMTIGFSHSFDHSPAAYLEVADKPWIRGVNLGGLFVVENFITPYFFALTDCTLRGDFHFFPNQIDAPPTSSPFYKPIEGSNCKPIWPYPQDEWTLLQKFGDSKDIAREYMEIHWDNFLKREDITRLAQAGVTHVRVPIGHWIMGDILESEPWIDGEWKYFERMVGWCREENIEVWPDLHTAPGSQNGFDNSGRQADKPRCDGWDTDMTGATYAGNVLLPKNVWRTLKAVDDISAAIAKGNMTDIVTGFGVLNEPLWTCDKAIVKKFDDLAFDIVRRNMGDDAAVYIDDMFNPWGWNDTWYEEKYENTFMDSHIYQVFEERLRGLSPYGHVEFTCDSSIRNVDACCYYEDKHSPTMGHFIGEWSAAFDQAVGPKLGYIMNMIRWNGVAPGFDRQIEPKRQEFLANYVKAQMVTYEGDVNVGSARGWFFWTFKMEGGAFAEWNFLRGLEEGWIPKIPDPYTASIDVHGSCRDILAVVTKDMSIVHQDPPPRLTSEQTFVGRSTEKSNRITFSIVVLSIVLGVCSVTVVKMKMKNGYTALTNNRN